MYYDIFTQGLTVSNAFDAFLTILGRSVNFGAYREAYQFFSNFISNIGTAFSNPSISDILGLLPSFLSTLVQIIPGLQFATAIAVAYDLAVLI